MRRREFIAGLSSAAAWPLAARAQQPTLPVIGFVNGGSADGSAGLLLAFRKGLGEMGWVDGQNVLVEYHWLEGRYNGLTALMADLVRRRVTVIATANAPPVIAAKAATMTIPIVFTVGQDPVKLGVVASLARPAATRPASMVSTGNWRRCDWHSCINWRPRPFVSPCWTLLCLTVSSDFETVCRYSPWPNDAIE